MACVSRLAVDHYMCICWLCNFELYCISFIHGRWSAEVVFAVNMES